MKTRGDTPAPDALHALQPGSVIILNTSAPNKRAEYPMVLNAAEADVFLVSSGQLDVLAPHTEEEKNDYQGNLEGKKEVQKQQLQDPEVQKHIRAQLVRPDAQLVGMTEDSGWQLLFEGKDKTKQQAFHDSVREIILPQLREDDHALLDNLEGTGFPGPNFKPLQERLGGFDALMGIIYQAAEVAEVEKLSYLSTVDVALTFPEQSEDWEQKFESKGDLPSKSEYQSLKLGLKSGQVLNSDVVQIPDGQKDGAKKTLNELIEAGLFEKSSAELPAQHPRRQFAEFVQRVVGKKPSKELEHSHTLKIAYLHSGILDGGKGAANASMPALDGVETIPFPANAAMRRQPYHDGLKQADLVVVIPEKWKKQDSHLTPDPNLEILVDIAVASQVDPQVSGKPIVVDNRSERFDDALKLFRDYTLSGRLLGGNLFRVVQTNEELENTLKGCQAVVQRTPVTKKPDKEKPKAPEIKDVPKDDGVFTLFVAGGHSNNAKKDLEDAHALGYFAAEQGWRIVTGAGSLEGSMGATHTGFVQCHLDKLQGPGAIKMLPKESTTKEPTYDLKEKLAPYYEGEPPKYNAEKIIKNQPELIEQLAEKKVIPRHLFYGYSMSSLVEQESMIKDSKGNAIPAPGITYGDTVNIVRRVDALLAPGTKVFMPGSIGTDQEFVKTIKQHIDAKKTAQKAANDAGFFKDGTPDDQGAIVIYNPDRRLNSLLQHFGIREEEGPDRDAREEYNIKIVKTMPELKQALEGREKESQTWRERINVNKAGAAAMRV